MHPRIRLPLWLAIVLPLAAYAYRSIVQRGGDWRPDLPLDVILIAMLVLLIAGVGWMRAASAKYPHDEAPEEEEREDHGA